MKDLFLNFGGAVKALDNGRVGGYLVRFSSENDPDISSARDFFTKSTDFDLSRGNKVTIYYDHALDPTLKNRKLGYGEVKVDDVGLWVEAQLELRDQYEAAVYAMARDGKLGWSSGTANHLVERKKVGGAHQIVAWPIGLDASLTPTPAEPRNAALSLKSVFTVEEYLAMKRDEESPAGENEDGKKTAFFDALMESIGPHELVSALYRALEELGERARASAELGQSFDARAEAQAAAAECASRITAWAQGWADHFTTEPEYGYLMSLGQSAKSLEALKRQLESDCPIEAHSKAVETTAAAFAQQAATLAEIAAGVTERWERRAESRKSGRAISASNEKKIREACAAIMSASDSLASCHKMLGGLVNVEETPTGKKELEIKNADRNNQVEAILAIAKFAALKSQFQY